MRILQGNMAHVQKKPPPGPLSKEQEIWIVLEFGACRNITQVRRNFRKQFFKSNPKAVPQRNAFQRIVNRFETEGVKSKEILASCNSAS